MQPGKRDKLGMGSGDFNGSCFHVYIEVSLKVASRIFHGNFMKKIHQIKPRVICSLSNFTLTFHLISPLIGIISPVASHTSLCFHETVQTNYTNASANETLIVFLFLLSLFVSISLTSVGKCLRVHRMPPQSSFCI